LFRQIILRLQVNIPQLKQNLALFDSITFADFHADDLTACLRR